MFRSRLFLSIPFFLLLGFCTFSCDRLKQKGKEVATEARAAIVEKKADVGDKLIRRFDAHHPDTRFNKKRFREFFGFAPAPDVQNLYCHADEMGIDSDYQFSFTCDTATVMKIVGQLQLQKGNEPDNISQGLWHKFPWWDSAGIRMLIPYSRKMEYRYYQFLWYDQKKSKAYYFAYDI